MPRDYIDHAWQFVARLNARMPHDHQYSLAPIEGAERTTLLETHRGATLARFTIDLTTGVVYSGTTGEKFLQL